MGHKTEAWFTAATFFSSVPCAQHFPHRNDCTLTSTLHTARTHTLHAHTLPLPTKEGAAPP